MERLSLLLMNGLRSHVLRLNRGAGLLRVGVMTMKLSPSQCVISEEYIKAILEHPAERLETVEVMDADGRMLGKMTRAESRNLAREKGLCLVEKDRPVQHEDNVPLLQLISGKQATEIRKQQLKQKKTKNPAEKRFRLGCKINAKDLETKAARALQLIEKGHVIDVTVTAQEGDRHVVKSIIEKFKSVCTDKATCKQVQETPGKVCFKLVPSAKN